MAFLKVNGFHTGVTGKPDGIGDFLRAVDAAGVPFFAYCASGTTSLIDAQEIMRSSDVSHNAVFRRVRFPHNQGGYDVPDYNLEPREAAILQWESHRDRWPSDLDPNLIYGETVNELRKEVEWADWIGEFCYETAVLALNEGWKWIGPGYSTGTPDEGSWDTPGMQKFLRIASENRGRIGVALHEYSLDQDDITYNLGFHVGRFRFMNESCLRHGFKPPNVFFTEWGWGERNIPSAEEAIKQIIDIGALYAQYSNVKGAAIWALDGGWGTLHEQTHKLMKPLEEALIETRYNDPVDPDPEDEVDYVVVANLVPHEYITADVDHVVAETWERKQSIVASADDAGRLVKPGKPGSHVMVWDAQLWKDDIVAWLKANYGVAVETKRTKPIIPPIPDFPIPEDRDHMPLVIDVSRWQDRNGNGIPDDLDFEMLRDIARVRGVIIRTSQGGTVDYMYDDWLRVAGGANLPTGNYHRLAGNIPAAYQFEVFMSARVEGKLGDWLDVEKFGDDIPTADQVLEFERLYWKATGKQIGIYTNFSTWHFHVQLRDRERPLWLANYESEPGALERPVAVPKPWKRDDWTVDNTHFKYWQYGAYTLPGSPSPIDCNAFHGSHAEFNWRYSTLPPNPEGKAALGLHAGADGGDLSQDEFDEFTTLDPGVIKILSSTGASSVARLATENPLVPFIIRAFLDFGGRDVSPQQFIDWTIPDVERAIVQLKAGNEVWIELHNEPNLSVEGLGSSWANGEEFNDWFMAVLAGYRREIPGGKYLFPGLSPGGSVDGLKLDSWEFLIDCTTAVKAADGLAIHSYWSKDWPMEQTFAQIDPVVARFPNKPIWITEASNNRGGVTPVRKAEEYVGFVDLLRKDYPEILGVTYFIASASNPGWQWLTGSGETWVDVNMAERIRALSQV